MNQKGSKQWPAALDALFVLVPVVRCVKDKFGASISNWVACILHNSNDKRFKGIGYIDISMKTMVHHTKRIPTGGPRLGCDFILFVVR